MDIWLIILIVLGTFGMGFFAGTKYGIHKSAKALGKLYEIIANALTNLIDEEDER